MAFRPFRIGRYRFVRLIDRGSTAWVYLVDTEEPGGFLKTFAVKRVGVSLSDRGAARGQTREAIIHSCLTHPNIVRVFEYFKTKESIFLVMEYVEGRNLRSLTERLGALGERLPVAEALFIARELARALAYAHAKTDPRTGKPLDLIHRDISPKNVMISTDGEVKLLDFGIACTSVETRSTATGCVRGTLAYMSPEQVRGEEIDQRSDVFSVGLVLLELLAGCRIFDGDSELELMRKLQACNIPAASSLNPEVPDGVDAVIKRATARDRAARYATMSEFLKQLDKCLSRETRAPSASSLSRTLGPLLDDKRGRSERGGEECELSLQEERALVTGFQRLEKAFGIEAKVPRASKRGVAEESAGTPPPPRPARRPAFPPRLRRNMWLTLCAIAWALATGLHFLR